MGFDVTAPIEVFAVLFVSVYRFDDGGTAAWATCPQRRPAAMPAEVVAHPAASALAPAPFSLSATRSGARVDQLYCRGALALRYGSHF